MLKGVNKQIIEINDTGNDCFEKVLFFVKPDYYSMSHSKLKSNAKSYIDSLLPKTTGVGFLRKQQKKKRLQFLYSAVCFAGACAVAIGLIYIL